MATTPNPLAALLDELGYADVLVEDGPSLFCDDQWAALAAEAGVDTPDAAGRTAIVASLTR